MKRAFFAIMGFLVLGVLFVGCPTGGATDPGYIPTKFEGSWTHRNPDAGNDTITITGNNFTKKWNGGNISGSFVFDDITITFTDSGGETYTTDYELTNAYLHLKTGKSGWNYYGQFYKKESTDNGKWGGYGVCLVKDSDFATYKTATNNFENIDNKQTKPTGIAYVETLTTNFTANFKEAKQNNPNYNESYCNGWWTFDGQGANITIPAGNYYIIIIPIWLPAGNWDGDFSWRIGSSKIYIGNGGSSPTTITNTANPQTCALPHFKNASEVFNP